MNRIESLREIDWLLVVMSLALCGLGVLQIYSATLGTRWQNVWWKQVIYIAAGLAIMYVATRVDYHTLLGQVPLFYGATLVLLLVVLVVGTQFFGSRRWIPLAFGFHFQVSEFAKVVIILLVARYLTGLRRDHLDGRDLLKLGGLVALPAFLVFRQPDLGTASTYAPILGAGVFLAGIRFRHVAIIGTLLIVGPWTAYKLDLLKGYQKTRWESFLNPEAYAQGPGYHAIQSKIAVGSGHLWGRGITKGRQTQLGFLPVRHADFIFATFAEEHGFVGVVVALGLYLLLILQIVQNGQQAADRAGMYICMGVAVVLLYHLLVNTGMVAGLVPITGIPLPLMSAGGSSMLTVFLMLGLVQNVRLRRFL